MSRYVQLQLATGSLEEIACGLSALGLTFTQPHGGVTLDGSFECVGEPVDLRLAAGVHDSVEDFGFARTGDTVTLVCGELDRALLERSLLGPLHQQIELQRVLKVATQAGLQLEEVAQHANGARRLVLRVDCD